MGLKIFKAIWFLSVLVVLADLILTYAGLPELVIVQDSESGRIAISRDTFFYCMTGIIALVNVMVYVVSKAYKANLDLRAWFHGLVIALNFFFIISMNFVGLFNSSEHYDYKSIEFIIYGSVGLFVLWTIGWPVYLVFRKYLVKEPI